MNKKALIALTLMLVLVPAIVFFNSTPDKSDPKIEIEKYLNENIEKIVPQEHWTGGTWFVTDIEFISDNQVVVSYEDGHYAGMLELSFTINKENISYQIIE